MFNAVALSWLLWLILCPNTDDMRDMNGRKANPTALVVQKQDDLFKSTTPAVTAEFASIEWKAPRKKKVSVSHIQHENWSTNYVKPAGRKQVFVFYEESLKFSAITEVILKTGM